MLVPNLAYISIVCHRYPTVVCGRLSQRGNDSATTHTSSPSFLPIVFFEFIVTTAVTGLLRSCCLCILGAVVSHMATSSLRREIVQVNDIRDISQSPRALPID